MVCEHYNLQVNITNSVHGIGGVKKDGGRTEFILLQKKDLIFFKLRKK